jgi:hypothetical protein
MFQQKPIAYSAGLAHSLGSVESSILLGQLLYWNGLGRDKVWSFKTIAEMKLETGLSRSQQERVIGQLKSLGLIEVVRKSIPAKRHFKLNVQKIENYLASSLQETSKLESDELSATDAQNLKATTKSNQRNTSKGYQDFLRKREELKRRLQNG